MVTVEQGEQVNINMSVYDSQQQGIVAIIMDRQDWEKFLIAIGQSNIRIGVAEQPAKIKKITITPE